MSTGTLSERDMRDMTPGELKSLPFQMPELNVGQIVVWWQDGQRSSRGGEAAVVMNVSLSGRNVELYLLDRRMNMPAVRHVDDPKLRINEHHREPGAWEYTEDHKLLLDLHQRVMNVEEPPGDQNGETAWDRYRALKSEAKKMGIRFTGHPKKEFLIKAIEDRKAEIAAQQRADEERRKALEEAKRARREQEKISAVS